MANQQSVDVDDGRKSFDNFARSLSTQHDIELATKPGTTATPATKQDDPFLVAFTEPFDAENPK
jgi:hypothetical protein